MFLGGGGGGGYGAPKASLQVEGSGDGDAVGDKRWASPFPHFGTVFQPGLSLGQLPRLVDRRTGEQRYLAAIGCPCKHATCRVTENKLSRGQRRCQGTASLLPSVGSGPAPACGEE